MLCDFLDQFFSHILWVELAKEHERSCRLLWDPLILNWKTNKTFKNRLTCKMVKLTTNIVLVTFLIQFKPRNKSFRVFILQSKVPSLSEAYCSAHQVKQVSSCRSPLKKEAEPWLMYDGSFEQGVSKSNSVRTTNLQIELQFSVQGIHFDGKRFTRFLTPKWKHFILHLHRKSLQDKIRSSENSALIAPTENYDQHRKTCSRLHNFLLQNHRTCYPDNPQYPQWRTKPVCVVKLSVNFNYL